jgi:isocitrate dehydrogenase
VLPVKEEAMPVNITMGPEGLRVPDEPIIPFIEGDGTGPDIWAASVRVFDAAVAAAYGGRRRLAWMEVLAGQKAFDETGEWLPATTVESFRTHLVGIKGPLTTPIGGGFRSINVTLRQILDLYACVRPVRWYQGVPSPVKHPEKVDMVIFRENTEDVYLGKELESGSEGARHLLDYLKAEFGWELRPDSALAIKPISRFGTRRLVRAAIRHALDNGRHSVTLVHKGNIMKYTEGAFRAWGYQLAEEEFGDRTVSWDACGGEPGDRLLIKDAIADAFFQHVLTRPEEHEVIATMNLNGDYISDALAAQVGGIGIAPGGNINYDSGHAVFEATHGTAPRYAGKDKVNPGSVILSGVMMLKHLGWGEAADLIEASLEATIADRLVTYDLARLMEGATEVRTSEFASAMIERM